MVVIPKTRCSIQENLLRHIDYAVKCIQRALTKVECDQFTPVVLSPEISDYLIDLTVQYPDDASQFSKFVISLPNDAIENELKKQVLPENLRQMVHDYQFEHESLQIKKENHIVDHSFDQAAKCRDQQYVIARSIRELVADQKLTITPLLVDSVLRSLGFSES